MEKSKRNFFILLGCLLLVIITIFVIIFVPSIILNRKSGTTITDTNHTRSNETNDTGGAVRSLSLLGAEDIHAQQALDNTPIIQNVKPESAITDPDEINLIEIRDTGGVILPKSENDPVQETPGKYTFQQLKDYTIRKKDLISKILDSLEKKPIDIDSVELNLEALKTLRDTHEFGNKDIPDAEGCLLAQGMEEKAILSAICSAWEDRLVDRFLVDVEHFYFGVPDYEEAQIVLETLFNRICEFNSIPSSGDIVFNDLTDLRKLRIFIINREISKVYPITYNKNYQQSSIAPVLIDVIRRVSGEADFDKVMPSFGIDSDPKNTIFLLNCSNMKVT
jgi:hypothetical protein